MINKAAQDYIQSMLSQVEEGADDARALNATYSFEKQVDLNKVINKKQKPKEEGSSLEDANKRRYKKIT